MSNRYEQKIEMMIANYEKLKKAFKWEADLSKHLVALNYATKDKALNIEELKDVKDYLKKNTGAFSPFRGTMSFALAGLVTASSEEPKIEFDKMISNQSIMKSAGFKNTTYLPTALYALSTAYEGSDIAGYCEKAMFVYKEMRKNHPLLTSGDDYALSILLAGTSKDPDVLEDYYKELNSVGFAKTNGLQMLSHILSFSEKSVAGAVERCKYIYDELKAAKLKVTYDYYPAIGLISLLEDPDNQLVKDLIEVADYLRNQKKYKWLGKGINILMASAIIASEYVNDTKESVATTAVQVSIQTIIAAQQAAMIAAIGASTAASAAT